MTRFRIPATGRRGPLGWVRGCAGVFVAATLALGCGGDDPPPGANTGPRVGLVFDVGGRGDKSFNDSAHRGLLRARDSLGIELELTEPHDGAERESGLRLLASGDASLVIGVGFLFSDDIRQIAEEFPDKQFACIDYSLKEGETLPANLRAIRFREEQGSFLVGALAALTSETGTVGFIGGMDMPLIHRFETGFIAGAKHVRSDIEVIVGYAGVTAEAFANPSKGRELAYAQYDQGADILYHAAGATGLGIFEAARKRRRFAIGVDSDQWDAAPTRVLTSMVKRVDVAVFDAIRDHVAGEFTGGVVELGLADDGVDYVYDDRNRSLIPDDVHEQVEALRADIVAGRISVPRTRNP